MTGIGTLKEHSLHAAIKDWYARPGDRLEEKVDGFVIDIVRGDLHIEIQTRNFSAIKRKLRKLVEDHLVRLVHPIPQTKWILRQERDGRLISKRKSPKRGRLEHLFAEMVRIPDLLTHPNFSIEVLLTQEEEILRNDGRGSWRRKGWSIYDRRLVGIVDQVEFHSPEDLLPLLPNSLPFKFTNKELSKALGIRLNLAQKMTYCLRKMDALEVNEKRGNAYLYSLKNA